MGFGLTAFSRKMHVGVSITETLSAISPALAHPPCGTRQVLTNKLLPSCNHILLIMAVNLPPTLMYLCMPSFSCSGLTQLPSPPQQPASCPSTSFIIDSFSHPQRPLHLHHSSLPEPRTTSPHHVPLAHQLGIELAAVQRQVDVKVDTVECALGRVHPLEVLLEVFP
jgi:hypothetical protein